MINVKFWAILIATMWFSIVLGGYITPMVQGYLGPLAIIAPIIPASIMAIVFYVLWTKVLKRYSGGSL